MESAQKKIIFLLQFIYISWEDKLDCFCTMICMYVRVFFLRLRYVCRNIKLTYDIARLIASFSRWSIVLWLAFRFSHLPMHICRTARKILEFTGSSSVRGSCRPLDASASSPLLRSKRFAVLYNANLPQVVVSWKFLSNTGWTVPRNALLRNFRIVKEAIWKKPISCYRTLNPPSEGVKTFNCF